MEHSDNPENYRELGQSVELESDPCREPERGRIQRSTAGRAKGTSNWEKGIKGTREQGESNGLKNRKNPCPK